jgi:uncharacterized protein (DUF983 family)
VARVSGADDGRRTSLLVPVAVVAGALLGVVAVVGHSTWAAVGVLVILTPILIVLVLRWISRL